MRATLLPTMLFCASATLAHAQSPALDPREVAASTMRAEPPAIAPPTARFPGGYVLAEMDREDLASGVGGGVPLALTDVLASLASHPTLRGLDARVDSAEGARAAAEGGFDPLLSARGSATVFGYYEYGRFDASIQQPTPLWGLTLFGGWRIGRGFNRDLPDYYRYDETLDGGELRGGVTLPILRDGWIDGRRATLSRAQLGVGVAEGELDARRIRLELAATEAYTRWTSAGLRHVVATELLSLAVTRDDQIAARVAAGLVPAIEQLENRRAILERRTAQVATARALERAALQLSLYYRDASGTPRLAEPTRVPSVLSLPTRDLPGETEAVSAAWEARPELTRLDALVAQAAVAAELARNQVLPRLDVTVSASGDLGTTNDPATVYQYGRPTAEGILTFQMPLALREARGRLESAEADQRFAETERDLARDTIAIEVRDALSAVRAAVRGVHFALESAAIAEAVADAERVRFDSGVTTLFVVNQREAGAATAQLTAIDAQAELVLAHALLHAAMGTRDD